MSVNSHTLELKFLSEIFIGKKGREICKLLFINQEDQAPEFLINKFSREKWAERKDVIHGVYKQILAERPVCKLLKMMERKNAKAGFVLKGLRPKAKLIHKAELAQKDEPVLKAYQRYRAARDKDLKRRAYANRRTIDRQVRKDRKLKRIDEVRTKVTPLFSVVYSKPNVCGTHPDLKHSGCVGDQKRFKSASYKNKEYTFDSWTYLTFLSGHIEFRFKDVLYVFSVDQSVDGYNQLKAHFAGRSLNYRVKFNGDEIPEGISFSSSFFTIASQIMRGIDVNFTTELFHIHDRFVSGREAFRIRTLEKVRGNETLNFY